VIAAAISDAMLLPTDECFAQEVPESVYDCLTCPKYEGSIMVWWCISHDCKLDLVTIQGNLTGDQYIRDVLQPVVVQGFCTMSLNSNHVVLSTMPNVIIDVGLPTVNVY
jgi:hypothetical protein